jgi:hypothetical protein
MRGHLTIKIFRQTSDEKLNYLVLVSNHDKIENHLQFVSLQDCEEFFCWSLELLIQGMEMDPNRFESVLEPLPEGHRKTRIREALLSNIEGEQDLKQIVAGKTLLHCFKNHHLTCSFMMLLPLRGWSYLQRVSISHPLSSS